MTNLSDQSTERPTSFVSQRGLALTVYILYLIGYLTGFTAMVGVIIAHVKASFGRRDPAKPLQVSDSNLLDRASVSRPRLAPCLRLDRHLDTALVARLEHGSHHQGNGRLERRQADRQTQVVAIWLSSHFGKHTSILSSNHFDY